MFGGLLQCKSRPGVYEGFFRILGTALLLLPASVLFQAPVFAQEKSGEYVHLSRPDTLTFAELVELSQKDPAEPGVMAKIRLKR